MKRYRKKPVVIEALQWNGKNLEEVKAFVGEALSYKFIDNYWKEYGIKPQVIITINTLEGKMQCSKGDFIIKGVDGEFYPCKPDIFKKTYEEV